MRPSFLIATAAVLFFQTQSYGQTITSVEPRSFAPGETTRLTLKGKNLEAPIRLLTTNGAAVKVKAAEAGKLVAELTLPDDASLGPMKLWAATKTGPTHIADLLVDDLPTIADNGDNHSLDKAQTVPSLVAINGTSDGSKSDLYRFHSESGQRIAFEVLTQALQSSMDPVVRLLDTSGQQLHLCDDDEVGPECRFSYTFENAGDYFLELRDNRFTAGDNYHLRIGDFPLIRHCVPMAVKRGTQATIRFACIDESHAEPIDFVCRNDESGRETTVSGKLPGGRSSSWTRLSISDLTQHTESGAQATSLALPIGISGRLDQPGQVDAFELVGEKGQSFRFTAVTRSHGSRAMVKLRLYDSAGQQQVAESPINDSDEWSFDYAFPDDTAYRLEVTDLLGRGGVGFGYRIDITPKGTFQLALQADAKTRDHFAIEPVVGGCAVDLQIVRHGYNGEISLSIDEPSLTVINPTIAANAKTARMYLAAGEDWKSDSARMLRITGIAAENEKLRAVVHASGLARVKSPHVLFPFQPDAGIVRVSGVPPSEDHYALRLAAPLQFARGATSHVGAWSLKRSSKQFKAPVTLLGHELPDGWTMGIKTDKDTYQLTFSRSDVDHRPDALSLRMYSEFGGRARLAAIAFPIDWIDPVSVSLTTAKRLVAGRANPIRVRVQRQGNDPQPATLTFTKLPTGWTAPESIALPANASVVDFHLMVAGPVNDDTAIEYVITGQYHGADISTARRWKVPPVIPVPDRMQIYPEEVALTGPQARKQLIVTGFDALGAVRDWTADVVYSSADTTIAEVRDDGVVIAKSDGETRISARVGNKSLTVPVHVSDTQTPRRIAFESEVLVALSKQGCNSGACHGSPSGKGMFRLSLRAFDKELDELTLVREDFGRRINRIEPESSVLLLKPLMKVSHGGGKQLHVDDPAYAILRDWIATGAQTDPSDVARCDHLEVFPNEKRILSLSDPQQLSVTAHFSDGSSRDVTRLVAYESSNRNVATVDRQGNVTPVARGEAVILVRFLEHIESVPMMFVDQDPTFQFAARRPANYVDEWVNAKLRQLQYSPSPICSDSDFVRRVYLDVIGVLPTIAESKAFLADNDPDKRSRLIDALLQRDEFAKFWALKWGDLLKMTGKSVGDEGVHKYHRWVEEALRTNMPYDQFASELLTASGSTHANPPANFYRTASDMNDCVETVSQVFLGARLQCAKCHNHPFEHWTQDNYYGLGAFFNRLQRRKTQRPGEMFVYTSSSGEVTQPRTGQTMKPWLPAAGGAVNVPDGEDRRITLVDWLVDPDNPYFARIEANRIWAQCFSRGIVEPIDDFRASNPPSNEPLLDALAKDFSEHGFDRKHLLRTVLNSNTYQSSYESNASNREDTQYFSHQQPRLLSAEQLLDAVNHTTGLSDSFGSLPAGTKATHLPAPDLAKVDFLKVFGQPERSTVCACERVDNSNLGMAIELFNGKTIHSKLADANNRFRKAIASGADVEEALNDLYLAALCRYPSESEIRTALKHCEKRDNVAKALEDICWALINTDEFLFQH